MLPENETVENIQAENTPLDTPEIQSESQTQEVNTENDTVVEDELSLLKNELEEQKNKYLRLLPNSIISKTQCKRASGIVKNCRSGCYPRFAAGFR